jgi:lipopolysaccharide/colanic/teichoic acid biosynthesis glycosyltransferase
MAMSTQSGSGAAVAGADLARRALDLAVSGVALAVTWPILAAAAGLIVLEDGGPVFYPQERVGQGGRLFRMHKLRSMRVNDLPVHVVGQVSHEHPMVTRVGRFIRRFKIDELPQMVNVLAGEMSVIGPRPTVAEQVERYTPFQRRRLEIRPGITGWAQVNGATALTWDERIMLDVWYIDHRSLWLDLRILLRTPAVALFGERPDPAALQAAREHAARIARGG